MSVDLTCKYLGECGNGQYGCHVKGREKDCTDVIELPGVEELLSEEQRKTRITYLKEIRAALKKGRAVLAVGAGVSIPMNMPNWGGLISQLAGHALRYDDYKDGTRDEERINGVEPERGRFIELERALMRGELKLMGGVNVLEAAQYIHQTLERSAGVGSSVAALKGILSIIIEESFDREAVKEWYRTKHGMEKDAKVTNHMLVRDNSLLAVAYLLRAKGGFRRAMTYNYDTLIQEYLISMFRVPLKHVVTHCEGWNWTDRGVDPIEIFHLHGCIPRKRNEGKYPAFPKESREIILSEDSYYNIEQHSAYNWQNSIQSYFLNRDTCVFVGFSADDYNFRRILRQMGGRAADSAAPWHYIFFTIDDLVKDTWKSVCRYHLAEGEGQTTREEVRAETVALLERELEMKKRYWERYHFRPIWVTVDDIPDTLLSLLPRGK